MQPTISAKLSGFTPGKLINLQIFVDDTIGNKHSTDSFEVWIAYLPGAPSNIHAPEPVSTSSMRIQWQGSNYNGGLPFDEISYQVKVSNETSLVYDATVKEEFIDIGDLNIG